MNSSSKLLRLGFVELSNSPLMAPLISYPKDPTECKLGGMLGSVLQSFYDVIARIGYNCTMTNTDRIGTYSHETGKWDGLVGLVQEKKVDASMFIFEPLMPGLEDVQHSLPLFESELCIACSYNYTDKEEDKDHFDILQMFINFDSFSYFITAMWFMFFVLMLSRMQKWISIRDETISNDFINQRKSSWWVNICAILDQDQYPEVNLLSIRILSICISLFYWIMFDNWMLGTMGTDLTIVKPPHVARSYQDILDSGSRIAISPLLPESRLFIEAKEGTIEHTLYQDAYIAGTDMQQVMLEAWGDIISQRNVGVFRCLIANMIAQLGIKVFIPDPSGKSLKHAHLWQNGLPDEVIIPTKKLILQLIESGLYKHVLDQKPIDTFGESIFRERFISTQVMLPPMPPANVKGQDVISLIYGLLTFIAFSLLVLLCEIQVVKLSRRKRKKKINVKVKSYT